MAKVKNEISHIKNAWNSIQTENYFYCYFSLVKERATEANLSLSDIMELQATKISSTEFY